MGDLTGSFKDYKSSLEKFAMFYTMPVYSRSPYLKNIKKFADVYISALVNRFQEIQEEYRSNKNAFDNLFANRQIKDEWQMTKKWHAVLKRLDSTEAIKLGQAIRAEIPI